MPPRKKLGLLKKVKKEESEEEDEEVDEDIIDDEEEQDEKLDDDEMDVENNKKNIDINDDDDDDDDGMDADGSADFVLAETAVKQDQWDVTAWITFLEEVEEGRGRKGLTIDEAYHSFLECYPRAAPFWKTLAEYHIKRKDYDSAQLVFTKCLEKCRSVMLWHSYISMISSLTIGKVSKYSDAFPEERKKLENAYENALKNVGTSVDSSSIWSSYIDFVNDWPEVGTLDSGRKLSALRNIYQRCVCIPLDDIDKMWTSYESLEMRAGEHLAEKVLPEYSEKKDHARTVLKDRRQLITGKISLDRLAIPPSQSLVDLKQLNFWKKLLIFELKNPENLDEEGHANHMQLVFDQCLCVLRFYPEIWLSYADYLYTSRSGVSAADSARAILNEAIEVLPQAACLHVAIAELEEREEKIEDARHSLNNLFLKQPSAFSFSVLQRFIRRIDGVQAARDLFQSTFTARMDPTKSNTLGYAIYMAHAELELHNNEEPEVALKVLELACERHPVAKKDISFVRLQASILVRLKQVVALRNLYESVLGGEQNLQIASKMSRRREITTSSTSSGDVTSSTSTADADAQTQAQIDQMTIALRDRLMLWEEYLANEKAMNMISIPRLDELRKQRDGVAALVDEQRLVQGKNVGKDTFQKDINAPSALDTAALLLERWVVHTSHLPVADKEMYERNRRDRSLLEEMSEKEKKRLASLSEAGRRGAGGVSDADMAALAAVPSFLRDLLPRLPLYTGPPIDVSGFIELLKKTVLPPKPHVEPSASNNVGVIGIGSTSTSGREERSGKRGRDGGNGGGSRTGMGSIVDLW